MSIKILSPYKMPVTLNLRYVLKLLFSLALVVSHTTGYAEGDHELLKQSVEGNDLALFSTLLEKGLDPTVAPTNQNPFDWIPCQIARKESDDWLKLMEKHNFDIHHTRNELLDHPMGAKSANMLLCSIINSSIAPFAYLVETGADIYQTICPRCTQDINRYTLLEYILFAGQYNQSGWLLENYPHAVSQANDKAIARINRGRPMRENRKEGFRKTVEILRAAGHKIDPDIK